MPSDPAYLRATLPRSRAPLGCLIAALVLAGCGSPDRRMMPIDSGLEPTDTGTDAGTQLSSVAAPATPTAPEPTTLAPCRAGWREVESEGVTTCDPWPASGLVRDCPAGEAHFPGEPGCAPIGTVCPLGEWPEGLPEGARVRFVRAGAAPGGDGTQERPYGTISDANDDAPTGTIIAIAKGTYDETIVLRRVTLWGACVAETIITTTGEESRTYGVITVENVGSGIRNLTVRANASRRGIWVGRTFASGELEIDGVRVEDGGVSGIIAAPNGTITGRSVVVVGTRATFEPFAAGISVQEGGTLELSRVVVRNSQGLGVTVSNLGTDSSARLEDILVDRTALAPGTTQSGNGVNVEDGGELYLAGAVITESATLGGWANLDARLEAEDLVVQDTGSTEHPGAAVIALTGGDIVLRRTLFLRNVGSVLELTDEGTTAELDHVVVREPRPQPTNATFASGMIALTNATLTILHADISDAFGAAIAVGDVAHGVVRNVSIRHTLIGGPLASGIGLLAFSGSDLDARQVSVEDSILLGVIYSLSTGTLEDVSVRTTRYGIDEVGTHVMGHGIHIQRQSSVVMRRVSSVDSVQAGVYVLDSATTIEDMTIEATRPQRLLGYGWGFWAEGDTDSTIISVARARIAGNFEAGFAVAGVEADATVTDLDVSDTRGGIVGGGVGIVSLREGSVSVERFRSDESALAGAFMSQGGNLVLRDGELASSIFGLLVDDAGIDLRGVLDEVVFRDNSENVGWTVMWVPTPFDAEAEFP